MDHNNCQSGVFLKNQLLILVCLVFFISTEFVWAMDRDTLNQQLVIVRGYAKKQIISEQNGLVVNADSYNGFVLTNADPFSEIETFTILDPRSGAELIAQMVWMDTSLDLAIIKANGLTLPPVEFSSLDAGEGDQVISARKSIQGSQRLSMARGTVRRTYPYAIPEQTVNLLFHDAGIDEEPGAILLLNDCDQLIGFNLRGDANNLKRSIAGRSLRSLLTRLKISTRVAPERCLSPIERAQQQADLAVAQAQQAKKETALAEQRIRKISALFEESREQNKALKQQTGRAESSAEKALEEVNRIQYEINLVREEAASQTRSILNETQQLLDDMEQQRKQAEEKFQKMLQEQEAISSQRQRLVYIALGLLALFLAVLVFLIRRKQKPAVDTSEKQVTESASHTVMQKRNFAEYVLDGKDDSGIRYMLRISSDQLNSPEGIVIGRNPTNSSYVINHGDVSRNHARLRIMKNRLFIEDLQSTNGTIVNGQPIGGRGLVTIGDGDQIIVGSIVMSLRVLQVA